MKFLCDADRCIECNACVTACKNENEVPWGINRRRVVTLNPASGQQPGSSAIGCLHRSGIFTGTMFTQVNGGLAHGHIAVKFDQVEGVEEYAPVLTPVSQPVEHREPIVVASYGLAIDQARRSLERECGALDQGEAAGPIMPVAGSRTPPTSRRTSIRKPSCLISCSHPAPASGRSTGLGRQGSTMQHAAAEVESNVPAD
jgi:ferredoxin